MEGRIRTGRERKKGRIEKEEREGRWRKEGKEGTKVERKGIYRRRKERERERTKVERKEKEGGKGKEEKGRRWREGGGTSGGQMTTYGQVRGR